MHSFCIKCQLQVDNGDDGIIPSSPASDAKRAATIGIVPLQRQSEGMDDLSPEQLLCKREHFDDVNANDMWNGNRVSLALKLIIGKYFMILLHTEALYGQ